MCAKYHACATKYNSRINMTTESKKNKTGPETRAAKQTKKLEPKQIDFGGVDAARARIMSPIVRR